MKAIVACTDDRIIGINNRLPWSYSRDIAWFRKCTTGRLVIMGHNTLQSIGGPLPNRTTIVLTTKIPTASEVSYGFDSQVLIKINPAIIDVSPLEAIRKYVYDNRIDISLYNAWICGGASIYRLFFPLCTEVLITRVPSTLISVERTVDSTVAYLPDLPSEMVRADDIDVAGLTVERWVNTKFFQQQYKQPQQQQQMEIQMPKAEQFKVIGPGFARMTVNREDYDQFFVDWKHGKFVGLRMGQAFHARFSLHRSTIHKVELAALYTMDGEQAKNMIENMFEAI
jgi:dihydrofolate reductase